MQERETPIRVQLRRSKGWKMPANTVKVDRTTKWGNPFMVGGERKMTRDEALFSFKALIGGYVNCSCGVSHEAQMAYRRTLADLSELRGKNLACWCRLDQECHADLLLELANREAV